MPERFDYRIGHVIQDRWQIVQPLGGGRTKVYLARDLAAESDVVLRFPAVWSQAVTESFRLNSIPRHPNVCYLHEVRMIEKYPMQVFDYIVGGTLQEIIDQGNGNEIFLLQACIGVCDGLNHLYHYGIPFHGDIKPSNLLWNPSSYSPQITDYGEIAFTSGFSALEFVDSPDGNFGQEIDTYSIGRILNLAKTHSLGLSFESQEIVNRAIDVDPVRRYSTVSDLRASLSQVYRMVTGLEPPAVRGPQAPSIGHALGRAVFLRERNRFDEALEILMEEVEAGHHMEQIYTAIGNLHYRKKELAEACFWFRRALQLAPAFVPALASLAAPGMGNEDERRHGLEILMRIAPDFPGTRVSYANLLAADGKLDEAEQLFQEATRANPEDIDAIMGSALFYSHDRIDFEKAKKAFIQTWKQWHPKNWNEARNIAMGAAAIGMCNILFAEKDFKNLGLWARRAQRFPSMKAHALLFLANVAQADGDSVKAKRILKRVEKEFPDVMESLSAT